MCYRLVITFSGREGKKQQQQFNSLDPTQHDLPAALLCPLFTMVVSRRSGKPIGAPPRVFCQRKTMWPRGSHPGDHQLVFFRAGVPGSILAWRCSLSLCLAVGRSTQILKSKQYNPLICDIKEGHKASTQTKFH